MVTCELSLEGVVNLENINILSYRQSVSCVGFKQKGISLLNLHHLVPISVYYSRPLLSLTAFMIFSTFLKFLSSFYSFSPFHLLNSSKLVNLCCKLSTFSFSPSLDWSSCTVTCSIPRITQRYPIRPTSLSHQWKMAFYCGPAGR